MIKIVIVHFQPLEKYPPVVNMIRYIAGLQRHDLELHVISTQASNEKKQLEVNNIIIHRIGKLSEELNRIERLLFYIRFQTKALSLLRALKPQKVLYYETLSAGAPFVYKKYHNKECEIFIHYHEYTSPSEYKQGMVVGRLLHYLEKKMYKQAAWVSHTNTYRAKLFKEDIGKAAPQIVHAIPNYPPENWLHNVNKSISNGQSRVGFVYVGAMSLNTMYVELFAKFIAQHPNQYYWDIYSDNFSSDLLSFFDSFKAPNIHFHGSIEYDALPKLLPKYDIGVVLYKGHILNYVYNAPNKVFEYLAAGLDVWYPNEMKGCEEYRTYKTYPEVLSVDFQQLVFSDVVPGKRKTGYLPKLNDYYFEKHISPMASRFLDLN
jgi:hypothetical protein